jgi:two-component system cell cycle response regulator DivK
VRRPDLIILDIQLPRVSGLQVISWLKEDESLRYIPVIAVTAFALPSEEQAIRAAGCDDYMAKPIATQAFLKIVDQHLSRPLGHAGAD